MCGPVAAESGVPGPPGGWAGLLAGETQGDAGTVHCLQVAGIRRRRCRVFTGVRGWAAETDRRGEIERETVRWGETKRKLSDGER